MNQQLARIRIDQLTALRRWARSPLGRALCAAEQTVLAPALSQVFGYHLVVIDPICQLDSLQDSRVPHRIIQACTAAGLEEQPALLACNEDLPWQTDSIDAFVLPHVLELSANPHQLLRELDRCLVAEGHLLILGFNPYGLWGLRRFLSRRRRQLPWSLRFISQPRLMDWLSLLGYATQPGGYYFPVLPWQHAPGSGRGRLLARLHRPDWPFLAAGYLLVARKRVTTLTPIKPRWQPRRSVLVGGAIEPTQRGVSHRKHG